MRRLLVVLAPFLLTSCISYSVGTTARPIPKGEFHPNLMVYAVPNGVEDFDRDGDVDADLSYASADFEMRWGLTDRSDIGLRVPAASGVIVNYKQMLNAVNDPKQPAYAVMFGAGVVNFRNHAYFEGSFLASGPEGDRVPYGGIRAMHVVPITSGAVSDSPTVGVFGGLRVKINESFAVSPELAIYHDEPALNLRRRQVIFIPSVTFHWRRGD
jgi:hypothetical protein